MNRKISLENEEKAKAELRVMILSEISEYLYLLRKNAFLYPTKENVGELKTYIKYLKDELDL